MFWGFIHCVECQAGAFIIYESTIRNGLEDLYCSRVTMRVLNVAISNWQ